MNKELNIGDYVRTEEGIKRVGNYYYKDAYDNGHCIYFEGNDFGLLYTNEELKNMKSSPNIIDLIEYMDLLWVKHPVKLYDSETTIGLFNPVRCDGFTEFEDGTHCIILNLDYLVNVKDLKISGIITHEQIESMKYKIGE